MVLGVNKRERYQLRPDKVWRSRYHRQLLMKNRGLTNKNRSVITMGSFKKVIDQNETVHGNSENTIGEYKWSIK